MNSAVHDTLSPPGPSVRPEYLRLPRDLDLLARSFGIALSPQLQRDAAVLAFSIECADRFLDAIPQSGRRARFSADILSFLRGEPVGNLTPELAGWLAQLKEVAGRHGAEVRFQKIIGELLNNSERMRRTRNPGRFIACAIGEGRRMVDLLLLVLAKVSTPEFDSFMRQLSGPANLMDKLRDARLDFRRGETAVKPTLIFRARLAGEIARRIAGLARAALVRWPLARWGVRSLFAEGIGYR